MCARGLPMSRRAASGNWLVQDRELSLIRGEGVAINRNDVSSRGILSCLQIKQVVVSAEVEHESVGFREYGFLSRISVGVGDHDNRDTDLRVGDGLAGGDRGEANRDRDGLSVRVSLREDGMENLEFGCALRIGSAQAYRNKFGEARGFALHGWIRKSAEDIGPVIFADRCGEIAGVHDALQGTEVGLHRN